MEEKNKFLSLQTVIKILACLVLINLLFLDIFLFANKKPEVAKIEKNVPAPVPVTVSSCPSSCLSEIKNATKTATVITAPTDGFTPTPTAKTSAPTPSLTPTISPVSATSLVKEFFVPLGTGSNSSDDWQDVGGLKATLNSANFGNIKTVTFEASVRIPTGNETAYVRLYNATDKHPVWFSDVSLEGGTPQLLISKPITLDSGNKTYQVQMKTSLKYTAFLDQSRLHIITN